MRQIWLKPNRRAILFGLIPPVLLLGAGLSLLLFIAAEESVWARGFGWAFVAVASIPVGFLLHQLRSPRLAFQDDQLLVFLGLVAPIRVPIEIVECFFLGQGPGYVPGNRESETKNVVVRLAERAEEWKHFEVRPTLGHWCDGYITIRGAWCEPLTTEVMERLNHRLALIHRQQKQDDRAD